MEDPMNCADCLGKAFYTLARNLLQTPLTVTRLSGGDEPWDAEFAFPADLFTDSLESLDHEPHSDGVVLELQAT